MTARGRAAPERGLPLGASFGSRLRKPELGCGELEAPVERGWAARRPRLPRRSEAGGEQESPAASPDARLDG